MIKHVREYLSLELWEILKKVNLAVSYLIQITVLEGLKYLLVENYNLVL